MSKNGRLPAEDLTYVQGDIRLANATAAAWAALVADVDAITYRPTITTPYGGYRSFSDQVKASGKGHHQYIPGTSVHGFGTCVDIWNWAAIGTSTLDRIGAKYGFRRTIPSEPWHYQHDGTVPTADDESTPIPTQTKKRRNDMTTNFINTSTLNSQGVADANTVYALAGDSPGTIANWQEYNRGEQFEKGDDPYLILIEAHGPARGLNSAQFASLRAAYLAPVRVEQA